MYSKLKKIVIWKKRNKKKIVVGVTILKGPYTLPWIQQGLLTRLPRWLRLALYRTDGGIIILASPGPFLTLQSFFWPCAMESIYSLYPNHFLQLASAKSLCPSPSLSDTNYFSLMFLLVSPPLKVKIQSVVIELTQPIICKMQISEKLSSVLPK